MTEQRNSEKRAKITVLLNRDEFERFDAYCEQEGFKKSTLVARLIREHLNKNQYGRQRELVFARETRGEGAR